MNRILVIGKSGQLGKSIHKLIADTKQAENFIFVGRKEIDFCDKSMIENYFKDNSYDIIINCAAFAIAIYFSCFLDVFQVWALHETFNHYNYYIVKVNISM